MRLRSIELVMILILNERNREIVALVEESMFYTQF